MAFAIFGEDAGGKTAQAHGGGIEKWLAKNHFLGLFHIGEDLMDWLLRAGGQAREGKRGGGKLEEIAAAEAVPPFGSAVGEFAMEHLAKFFCVGNLLEAAPI